MAIIIVAILLCVPGINSYSVTTAISKTTDGSLPSTCTRGYEDMAPVSTMCLQDNPRVVYHSVSKEDEELIVRLHNELRSKVEPPAKDMTQLIWDDSIAENAEKMAMQCIMEHDENRNQPNFPGIRIGQNLAGGYKNWNATIIAWYDEVNDYRYGENVTGYLGKGGFLAIGHYTQLVSVDSTRVGCGFAYCRDTKYRRYFVCNYAGIQQNITHPYSNGTRCSACPNTCNKGLCDCNGMVCYNHGKLNPDTCKCQCLSKMYRNDNCYELTCPGKDNAFCGDRYPLDYCVFDNVKPLCPYMCGICDETSKKICNSKFCENHGVLDWETCKCECQQDFTGDVCETKILPCDGKICQNGGRLDEEDTCDCYCRGGYYGEFCETSPKPKNFTGQFICSFPEPLVKEKLPSETCKDSNYGNHGHDLEYCESKGGISLTCDDCLTWYNVKTQYCPVMCGVCEPPCNGIYCLNDGVLEAETCKCTCTPLFRGEECELKNCPKHGEWYCKYFPVKYCDEFIGVPESCPYLCGVCP